MPIMWSRIHAELGVSPTPLTHDMVIRAIAVEMAETDDLDWKQALPPEVEKKRLEVAKDVAAMANTLGGLIVYGVREDNEKAVELTGVPNGERDRQALRSFVNGRVRPLVDGLVIEALDGEDGAPGVIAVFVPPSADAPHVIGEKNALGVPYRYGTDTHWMSESQLERAYRDRFSRRADDRTALRELISGLVPEIAVEEGAWVAVSTRPVASLPLLQGRARREDATASLTGALHLAAEVFAQDQGRIPLLRHLPIDAVNNPRTGLRRWVIRSNHHSTDPHERVDWALVELHHDGSIAMVIGLAWYLRGAQLPHSDAEVVQVPYRLVDSAVAEAVALAATHVRRLGGVGTILARAVLLRDETAARAPLVAIDNELAGGMSPTVPSCWGFTGCARARRRGGRLRRARRCRRAAPGRPPACRRSRSAVRDDRFQHPRPLIPVRGIAVAQGSTGWRPGLDAALAGWLSCGGGSQSAQDRPFAAVQPGGRPTARGEAVAVGRGGPPGRTQSAATRELGIVCAKIKWRC
ncbi:ATP-binding protein [Amycolatopsis sp. 195334CR]|uniref:ATP-binding protein n=1 Tax=Amycolatopsis sp. 195334CR TaxID=2814588 RepID=UPI001A8FB1AD|nr:ATP-binding protein [Amycolatopsis sp. 195334CR]MBN6040051.1 ATP-binding protein [Amycolatopsis sp. 195334CR]